MLDSSVVLFIAFDTVCVVNFGTRKILVSYVVMICQPCQERTKVVRAFFIAFSLGGQCPKRALLMVKKGSLRIINDYLHNP